ncbi:hypothetical protein E1293_45205 [Actinomadura darangshiensis]|uniref:Uncharacterized protein n=1 Tax=Actinomadura darangshiensis TaxID=705336 RepID=A0A4V2YQ83_9ACTN|nr:hypothetical protein [Actinomadura darangshiensis]TDD61117.1 hypothetical protein E1293_45205 [Actinomadura darangshiensis]
MDLPLRPPVVPSTLHAWRARRRLNRLARSLRRRGWTVQPHYRGRPPLLRVFDSKVPCIGDSIKAVKDEAAWHYVSNTGQRLAPCDDPNKACIAVAALLVPWILRAFGGRGRRP